MGSLIPVGSAQRVLSLSAVLLISAANGLATERFQMAGNFYIVHKDTGTPSLDEAAVQLRVPVEKLDRAFGVQPIDPRAGDYAVMKRDEADQSGDSSRGPFANPGIGTFGPPR
jgi:hypothetical protein